MPVKILVVDDAKDFRWIFTAVLRSDPIVSSVIEAEDGVEAIDLVRSDQPQIVVIDIMMPRLDGLQATRLIKQEWPETKVVVATSVSDTAYERAAYANGADAFVDKRHITTELLPIIRRLIGSSPQGPSKSATPAPRPDDVQPGPSRCAPS